MAKRNIKKEKPIILHGHIAAPDGDQLLIEVLKVEYEKGGLVGFDSNDDYQNEQKFHGIGHVVAMGPYAYEKAYFPEGPWCKVGDLVTFRRYAGDLDRDDDDPDSPVYRLLGEKDIRLILTPIEV